MSLLKLYNKGRNNKQKLKEKKRENFIRFIFNYLWNNIYKIDKDAGKREGFEERKTCSFEHCHNKPQLKAYYYVYGNLNYKLKKFKKKNNGILKYIDLYKVDYNKYLFILKDDNN